MNRESTPDELIERWTLAPSELVFLMNKSGPGRVGFAALLKFFQAEGRFPNSESEISSAAVITLSCRRRSPHLTGPSMTGWAARSNIIAPRFGSCLVFARQLPKTPKT